MTEVRVAILGAAGWMGKVHAMAYRTFPHFFGTSGGTARIVALVEANPNQASDLAALNPGARVILRSAMRTSCRRCSRDGNRCSSR